MELNGNQEEIDDTNYDEYDFEKINPDEPLIKPDEQVSDNEMMEEEKEEELTEA